MPLDIQKIKAVIFDMDGLLVNSEPCWQKAEMKIFAEKGLHLTLEMCLETTGKPIEDVIQYWYGKKPWPKPNFAEIKNQLIRLTEDYMESEALAMPGVEEVISLAERNQWKIGLASASPMGMIETVLKKLNLIDRFHFYHSAELEKFNKPNPAVYLTVARNLGQPIESCLILEDSGNGVIGAAASGAQVVAVPSPHDFKLEVFNKASQKVNSLIELLPFLEQKKEAV